MENELKREFEKLPDDIKWRLQRCDGYLDLRLYSKAKAELKHIPPTHRDGVFYLQLKLRILIETSEWPKATKLATALCEHFPRYHQFLIHRAYAARRVDGLEAAHTILTEAKTRFPKEGLIYFNLACYECQLGRLNDAQKNLKHAFKIDSDYRILALEDEDLEALWPEIE